LKGHDHQDDHDSSNNTDSKMVSSTQVPPMHSSCPILKKVMKDDIEKIKKAWAADDNSTSNDNEDEFTPLQQIKVRKR